MDDDKKIEKRKLPDLKQESEIYKEKKEKIASSRSIEKKEVLESIKEKSLEKSEVAEGELKEAGLSDSSTVKTEENRSIAREKEIEKTLEVGLEDIYKNMSIEKRGEFKRAGEETADKINKLLEKTKVKAKKIINLIKKWLSLIPGVNKFFLEQEAKIKTDEIMKLKMKL